ncbi:hypothetical protein J416_05733 [Gracilibacillus halophilus YIM-C55.5]|uniref:DUF4190 domain-containing protein n=1 Tax=Gracilibacillus halophilus YIM-C55.5 TaxID=1308866 RepID=N4WMW5_9BACI|nr:DUF4190 domain-containing protein [Gracilibacillus halophilus]ENH97487.1 hypothetical protein J416_05733 [Gracilibacillus halophilus YIM-C55.5]
MPDHEQSREQHEQNDLEVNDAVDLQNKNATLGNSQFVETDEMYSVDRVHKRQPEVSEELSANDFNQPIESDEQETQMQKDVNTVYGWAGLIVAIVSFFIWPLVMSIGGIVLGMISKSQGADTLGNAAIIVSAISLVLSLILIPMF